MWHGYQTDISDLKRVEEELRALSVTDALTGIHNRRHFRERLQNELERAQRDGLELAVIMLDIDHFKRINDQYGHAVGDHVLRSLCQRIGSRLRRTDVFCRLGARSSWCFARVAMPSRHDHWHWSCGRGSQCSGRWSGPGDGELWSGGLATGEGADALLLRADAGVYAAKQAGRDRVEAELR